MTSLMSRIEALGKMASAVAHDFNNSLTIIMGFAEIAQLDQTNTMQVEKSLKSIVRAFGNAAELTGSLLWFGRKDPTKKFIVEIKSFIAALAESSERLLPADKDLQIVTLNLPISLLINQKRNRLYLT
jgi:C4-dicarboxylate-specific signal transduction histidine kinase